MTRELSPGFRIARLVAFVFFLATLLIYTSNVVTLQTHEIPRAITAYFAEPLLVCCFLCSLAEVLAFLFAPSLVGSLRRRLGKGRLSVLTTVLYALGGCGYVLCVLLGDDTAPAVGVLCAVMLGVGMLSVCVGWARVFNDLALRDLLKAFSLAMCLAAALSMVMGRLGHPLTQVLFIIMLVIGSFAPLVLTRLGNGGGLGESPHDASIEGLGPGPEGASRFSRTCDVGESAEAPTEPGSESITGTRRGVDLGAFLSVMGMALLGMAIFSFAMGVQPSLVFSGLFDAQSLSMVIGALLVMPATRIDRNLPLYQFIYQAYLPIAASIALVVSAIAAAVGASDVALVAQYALYSMVIVIALSTASAVSNAREFPRSFVLAMILAVFCLVSVLGILAGRITDFFMTNHDQVVAVVTVAYGAYLMLAESLHAWRLTCDPGADDGETRLGAGEGTGVSRARAAEPETQAEPIEAKLARIAEGARLSPRETEIFEYIGKGHSSVYVAKMLLISESTVYTHVRNVYRKLGVASREELIQLINGAK